MARDYSSAVSTPLDLQDVLPFLLPSLDVNRARVGQGQIQVRIRLQEQVDTVFEGRDMRGSRDGVPPTSHYDPNRAVEGEKANHPIR
jgi:hypothetical protein